MAGKSEFWFRGYRVAWFFVGEANTFNFEFDTEIKNGFSQCNAPAWTTDDLLTFTDWIDCCTFAFINKEKLPDNVELT